MENKNLLYIISLIGIFIFMHYYFTFDYLGYSLGKYNLDIVSILSWEDIQFSIAAINIKTLRDISIMIWLIFASFATFTFSIKKDNKIGFKVVRNKFKSKWLFIFKIVIAIIFIILSILFYIFPYSVPIFTYFVILIAAFAYYKYKNIDIIALATIFLFITFMFNITKKNNSRLYINDIKVILSNDEVIKSDSINKLVFLGTKYIILENDSPNVKLYPTERIKEIEWINKK